MIRDNLSSHLNETVRMAAVCILRIQDMKARDFATRLDLTKIKKDDGLTYLIGQLDGYFKEDNTQSIFLAIEQLEKFRRADMSMLDYIREFHRKMNHISELMTDEKSVIYHDSIIAYKLLVQADLKSDGIKLVKAAMALRSYRRKE